MKEYVIALPPSGTVLREVLKTAFYLLNINMFSENPVILGDRVVLKPKRKGGLINALSELFYGLAESISKEESGLIEKMEKKGKSASPLMIFPMSGNDRKYIDKFLKKLKAKSFSEAFRNYAEFIDGIDEEEFVEALSEYKTEFPIYGYTLDTEKTVKLMVPQALKPEHYEFSRRYGQGLSSPSKHYLGLHSMSLALAGFMRSRAGRIIEKGTGQGTFVLLTPVDISYDLGNVYSEILRSYESAVAGKVSGLVPEEALILWLGAKARFSSDIPRIHSNLNIIAAREPGGQSPSSLVLLKTYSLWLPSMLANKLIERGDNVLKTYENVLQNAFRYVYGMDVKGGEMYVKYVKLLYEVLVGSKSAEEFLYTINRDLATIASSGGKTESWMRILSWLSRHLYWTIREVTRITDLSP
ncbi:MAG: hypothetical protein QXF84_03665 [Nitrososphaerota archaeon]